MDSEGSGLHMGGTLKCALRTLYEEIAEFRFDYPLTTVPAAGSRESLHYYLFKYDNRPPNRRVLRLDSNGIAKAWSRTTGEVYNSGVVARYAMRNLGYYLKSRDHAHLEIFLKQVDWLEQNAVIRADGAVLWPHLFDSHEGSTLLRAPWVSSNVQGLVISALVRGWRVTRRPGLLELLRGSARVFELDCASGGLRVQAGGHVVYADRPGFAAPGIMDGFMTSLLGLFDLYVETGDTKVHELFSQGVEGLRYFLPTWDYRKKWSVYSNRAYLCPPGYHCLNRMLLIVLARLTGDSYFAEYAENWNPTHLSALGRAEIYFAFLFSKNACRLKHRTWLQKTVTTTWQKQDA